MNPYDLFERNRRLVPTTVVVSHRLRVSRRREPDLETSVESTLVANDLADLHRITVRVSAATKPVVYSCADWINALHLSEHRAVRDRERLHHLLDVRHHFPHVCAIASAMPSYVLPRSAARSSDGGSLFCPLSV